MSNRGEPRCTCGHAREMHYLARACMSMTRCVCAAYEAVLPPLRIPKDLAERDDLAKFAGLSDAERAALDQFCADEQAKRMRGVLLYEAEPAAPVLRAVGDADELGQGLDAVRGARDRLGGDDGESA